MNPSKPLFPSLDPTGETDPETEAALLASLIGGVCGVGQVSRILTPASFSVPENGAVYAALLELETGGYRINAFEVSQLLKTHHSNPQKWAGVVGRIRASLPAVNAESAAFRLVELAAARYLKTAFGDALVRLGNYSTDALGLADEMRRGLEEFQSGISGIRQKPFSEAVTDWLRRKEDIRAGRIAPGLISGMDGIDGVLKGFRGAKLYILAARPGMGKTALACQLAYNIGLRGGYPFRFYSLEMGTDELTDRLVGIDSGYTNSELADVRATTPEHLGRAAANIAASRLSLVDNIYSIDELEIDARRFVREEGGRMIAIDYLQLITNGRGGSREQEIADISRRLKQLSKALNIPVLALSQLSRKVEERGDKRPLMGDLRESGAIEQDADVIMMQYRDEYYNPPTPETANLMEVHFRKHRGGFTTATDKPVCLHYDPPTNRVWDYGRPSPFPPVEGTRSNWIGNYPTTQPNF